jgi:hypothetical protein
MDDYNGRSARGNRQNYTGTSSDRTIQNARSAPFGNYFKSCQNFKLSGRSEGISAKVGTSEFSA